MQNSRPKIERPSLDLFPGLGLLDWCIFRGGEGGGGMMAVVGGAGNSDTNDVELVVPGGGGEKEGKALRMDSRSQK